MTEGTETRSRARSWLVEGRCALAGGLSSRGERCHDHADNLTGRFIKAPTPHHRLYMNKKETEETRANRSVHRFGSGPDPGIVTEG
jgi:hypothetical protein